jgi:hypothetical protein
MYKKLGYFGVLGLIFSVLIFNNAYAVCTGNGQNPQTWTAANASYAEVNACLSAAVDGDTINIPSGSAIWSSTLAINKAVTLRGAGVDQTIITQASVTRPISISGTKAATIRGFTFNTAYITSGIVNVSSTANNWRVTECKFHSTYAAAQNIAVTTAGGNGLVDNNIFINGKVGNTQGYNTYGFSSWLVPLGLGTNDALYVENNQFIGDLADYIPCNAIDGNYGGKIVFRYNTVTNAYLEQHGTFGDTRSVRKWEVYNNIITHTGSRGMSGNLISFRGGTGVIFNNTFTLATAWPGINTTIKFDHPRSVASYGTYAKQCDGTSPWDGNTPGQYGYPCRDQIGTSTDSAPWVKSDNPTPPQALDPAYVWNNTYNGVTITSVFVPTSGYHNYHIVNNRDYYVGTTAKPGYAPYTCPHPLAGAGSCTPGIAGTAGYSLTGTPAPAPVTYVLTTAKSGTGTITSNPNGINCGSTCTYSFTSGELVTLTATPGSGHTFSNWTGACSGAGTCSVTMSQIRSVTATFAVVPQLPSSYSLTVSRTGTGNGAISSAPSGIDCGTSCSFAFSSGVTVQLTATPDANSTFAGWSGACTGTTGCAVTMNEVKTVIATFTANPVENGRKTLTVVKNGNGKVRSVSSSPTQASVNPSAETTSIDCGDTCSAEFTEGANVTLLAEVTDSNYSFAGWSGGGCSGTGDCTVTVNDATSVTATFNTVQASGGNPAVSLSVGADGGGGGGCFIATAAFGSYLDPHVMVLREFRDKVLLKNYVGRKFVKLYYRHSPPLANSIAQNESLRTATRLALTPFIFAMAYPTVTAMVLLGALVLLLIVRRMKIAKPAHPVMMSETYFDHGPRKAFVRVR